MDGVFFPVIYITLCPTYVQNLSFLLILSECFYSSTYVQKRPSTFLWKGVLKISGKYTTEHSCRSLISINLQSNFIETTFRHGCSPVNLQHIFSSHFPRYTSGGLFLIVSCNYFYYYYYLYFNENEIGFSQVIFSNRLFTPKDS